MTARRDSATRGAMTLDPHAEIHERALIVDFGSQVTQLIARRLREIGVYCEIHPYNRVDAAFLAEYAPKAVILSGSPASANTSTSPRAADEIFELGVPILGICYGEQTICAQLGGDVEQSDHKEFGRAHVEVIKESALFDGVWEVGGKHQVWMSHGDRVNAIPEGFEVIAKSDGAPFAAIANEERKIYAVQFHPEVVHTPDGAKLLKRFTWNIAGLTGDWTMAAFREEAIENIRTQVGDAKVICGLSGGVDLVGRCCSHS